MTPQHPPISPIQLTPQHLAAANTLFNDHGQCFFCGATQSMEYQFPDIKAGVQRNQADLGVSPDFHETLLDLKFPTITCRVCAESFRCTPMDDRTGEADLLEPLGVLPQDADLRAQFLAGDSSYKSEFYQKIDGLFVNKS